MSIFFVPALVSLLIKLLILAYAVNGGKASTIFLSLVGIFAIHNAIEIFGYVQYLQDNTLMVYMLFRLYYVVTAYVVLYILLNGLVISTLESQKITVSLVSITTVFAFLILFTDSIISGQYLIGYTMTAIKGPFFWSFASYILIVLFGTVAILINKHNKTSSIINKTRCQYYLLALAPVIIVLSITILLKLSEANINATGFIPIATTLFITIILKTETSHNLTDIRRLMPISLERETANNFMSSLDYYIKHRDEEDVFKTVQIDVEREIILYSLKKCEYNVSHTSKMMGLKNRSTLYSMMKRLDIDLREVKSGYH